MGILLGILTSILTVCILVALEVYANFDLFSLAFFVIAPVGGVIIGMGSTYGFRFTKNTKLRYLLCLIFSALSIISAKYIIYRLVCLDPQTGTTYIAYNDPNNISSYIGFKEYYQFIIENSTQTIRFKGSHGTSFSNTTFNYISEVVSFLGVLFGGLTSATEGSLKNKDNTQNNIEDSIQENQIV
ncbi:hypothetical protein WG909_02115 [Peptostreptococcaceae bacterium AGR-M142]